MSDKSMNIIDRYTQFPLWCCLLYSFPLRFVFICWKYVDTTAANRLVFKMILRRFGEINLHLFPGHLKSSHNHCLQFYGYSPPLGKHALEILFITNFKQCCVFLRFSFKRLAFILHHAVPAAYSPASSASQSHWRYLILLPIMVRASPYTR